MNGMDDFETWLRRYGRAWEDGDADAICELFTPDAVYWETPFDPPMIGHEAIRAYWSVGAASAQTDVAFAAQPLRHDPGDDTRFATWQASFRRVATSASVELDGVLSARFAPDGRCAVFREWWHRRETPGQATP